MKIFDFKLGYSCNNDCIHCVIADKKERLSAEKSSHDLTTSGILQIIHDAKKNGVEKVILTGGEVTLRKDLALILQEISQAGMAIGIQTNGRKIQKKQLLDVIENIKHISFTIAIHGPTVELHDFITRRKGSFQETLEGMKKLLLLKKHINAKIVISRFNYNYLKSIAELLSSIGVQKATYAFPHGMGNAQKFCLEVIPTYTEIKPFVIDMLNYCNAHGISAGLEAFPLCTVDRYIQHINELQYLKNDEEQYLQVKEELRDWNKDRLSIKAKFEQCAQCIYTEICEGPWDEYPVIYGDLEFQPPEYDNKQIEKVIAYISSITMPNN